MTRRRSPSKTIPHPNQQDFLAALDGQPLIEVPATPSDENGGLDYDKAIRNCLNQAIEDSPYNREQIASLISHRVGRRITKPMLDTYTGASRPNKLPADLIPALTAVIGPRLLMMIGEASGCAVLEQQQATFARLGQLQFIIAQAKQQQEQIAQTLPLIKGMSNA